MLSKMARYHFCIDGDGHMDDQMGVELPNLVAARRQAATLVGELLRDRPDEFWAVARLRATVTDDDGRTLFTIKVEGEATPATVHPFPPRET